MIGFLSKRRAQKKLGLVGSDPIASVTGLDTDNTDPANPVINIAVDGLTVTGDGTPGNPLVATPGLPPPSYTDEQAQDAIGAMVDASLIYVDGTPLLTRAALTGDVTATQGSNITTIANGAVDIAKLSAIGTPSAATFLRGDNTWQPATGGATQNTIMAIIAAY